MNPRRIYKYFCAESIAFQQLERLELSCLSAGDPRITLRFFAVDEERVPSLDDDPERIKAIVEAGGDLFTELGKEYMEGIGEDSSNEIRALTAVVSMSSRPDNPLMWDRYAAALNGFCLEFSVDDLLRGTPSEVFLWPVQYRTEPYRFDPFLRGVAAHARHYSYYKAHDVEDVQRLTDICERQFRDVLTSAPLEFQHEQEWRLVIRECSPKHFPGYLHSFPGDRYRFPRAALRAVIIGERMTEDSRGELRRVVEGLGLESSVRTAASNPHTGVLELHG